MKKVLKILLFVSFITIIGCNGGGGGSSNEPLTVEITGWYTENIDTSFWSKTGKTYDETAYFSMKIEANAPDGIKDITYVEVSQERGSYWILRDNISGIDFYDSAEGAFIIRRCYNQNSPHLIWLSNYTAFAEDSAGNTATHTIDLSSPGALSSKDAIASENYSGDNRGPDMIKRASSILAFKGTSDLTIIFQVEDDRVYNGNVWFYNESAEYITESGYFKNTINDGFELFTDGSSNMLKIKASDLDLGSYAWDDIQGFHIVLMDGAQYIPKEYWDHRSISQYISSLKSDKSIIQLGYKVIDVEYSKQMDRIIMISDNPAQLHIFYPIDEENTSVDLPLTPTCVSVSPDGLYAVVGHDYLFSYINLTTAVLEKTIAVSTSVHDIVLAENGYAYVFPNDGGWSNIPSINIVTEIETQSTNRIGIHERTTARLHPDGEAIYGIPGGIMSPDLQKYSIINGTAEISGGSPYHIEYKPGGDLWISEDGLRIFTGSGNIFHSSNDRADDMFYYGSLSEQDSIEHMSDSTLANKVIAIPTDNWTNMGDTQIQIYAYDSLVFEKSIELPNFFLGNNAYPWHGKFVFISSDGSKYFVVIQADESSGIIDDFGVAIYDLE